MKADASSNFSLTYGRTDLLSELITRARAKALLNIAECKRAGIPCIEPIFLLEDADFDRDDKDADKVDTLTEYWEAGLQAKALTLLFESKKSSTISPK